MASYSVNDRAFAHGRRLIDARQYVLDSDWGDVQPSADAENDYLATHSWDEYAQWHLGLAEGATEETKSRYAFGYGDFRRVHRSGLIACVYPGLRNGATRMSSSLLTSSCSALTARVPDVEAGTDSTATERRR